MEEKVYIYPSVSNGKCVIPDGVTCIGGFVFHKCSTLTSITIPNSVTSIGNYAFEGCTGLTSIYISDIAAWCGIDFRSNPLSYAHHLYINGKEVKKLVIPKSVKSIRDEAFAGCSGLTSVTIPNSVTSIGDWAFYGCSKLNSITIGNSVTSIGDWAFSGCSSLTSITIPNSVTSVGYRAFFHIKEHKSRTLIGSKNISGFKGMQVSAETLSCRGFTYEVGGEYAESNIKCCERGFHFCTDIISVFNHYAGEYDKDFTICEVEGSGEFDLHEYSEDSKVCTSHLKVIRRLSREEVIDLINKSINERN